MNKLKTFEFKEGTVIAEVSQEVEFDMEAGSITDTGRFTACLIGGTVPGLKTMLLKDPKRKTERIFRSEEAAFDAAYKAAVAQGLNPKKSKKK